jgi:hypothetical protein
MTQAVKKKVGGVIVQRQRSGKTSTVLAGGVKNEMGWKL